MENDYSEFNVLKEIDEKISPLNQSSQQRIIDYVIAKYNLKTQEISPSTNNQTTEGAEIKKQHVKDFTASKKPIGYYERIACLAYYIEKNMNLEG